MIWFLIVIIGLFVSGLYFGIKADQMKKNRKILEENLKKIV
jgi:hypothetical protein